MFTALRHLLFFLLFSLASQIVRAQLVVVENNNAQELAQRLVGDGVIISNATLTTGNSNIPTGYFTNQGRTNLGIDSGIVITSGRAKSDFRTNQFGVDGNGLFTASQERADNVLNTPGDQTLATALGLNLNQLNDAVALEFDFVPLGDSIRFNYVMSSEEYDLSAVCTFNDGFGFFISGPGIAGVQNLALIPNTTTPVTITNVNNITAAGCVNNPQYYIDNTGNTFMVHNGMTTVFVATSKVTPCETYHLKLVIADRGDRLWDTGVYLEAKSLSSNAISMSDISQKDAQGNSYLVEGCTSGSITLSRPRKDPTPLSITLSYGGDAINGTDIQPLPTTVTIPANDSFITINVIPVVDNVTEPVEKLVVYALAGCAAGTPTDSIVLQIRDYDTLAILPGNQVVCKGSAVQLIAQPGYSVYQWEAATTLNALTVSNPVATPVNTTTTYMVTATLGTCNARDSIVLGMKQMSFTSKTDVNCRGGNTGSIKVGGGAGWNYPVEFSLDGITWQTDSVFNNLPAGNYSVKLRDNNCTDSIAIAVAQAWPDLISNNPVITAASCSGNADGSLLLNATGGNGIYQYSLDGIVFQSSNTFAVAGGNQSVVIRDGNGCTVPLQFTIPLINSVVVDAGPDTTICEGTSYLVQSVSNAASFVWTPARGINDPAMLSPTLSPVTTTRYYVTARDGICTREDSVLISIRPAPVADAGNDIDICIGKTIQLNGAGGTAFQWSPATYLQSPASDASPFIRPSQTITYSLMVEDVFGCFSLQADEVTVGVTPAVRIFAGNDTVAAIGQPIQLQVAELSTAGVVRYEWAPVNFLDNAAITSPVATLDYDMTFTVTGTTADDCQGTDQITIKVYKGTDIYVPTGFTPNNDGLNDVLHAIPVGIKTFKFFRVYNRWGEMVFFTQNPSRGWDGRIKGQAQSSGTFTWTAEAIDFTDRVIIKKGIVSIVR